MKNNYTRPLFFLMLTLFSLGCLYAQERLVDKGMKNYNDLAFMEASRYFEKASQKGYDKAGLYRKWANAQYNNSNYKEAVKGFDRLFSMGEHNLKAADYLRYATTLRSLGEDALAKETYQKYLSKMASDQKAGYSLEDYLLMIKENSDRYTMSELRLNTEDIEYGGSIYGDEFLFTTNWDSKGVVKREDAWNESNFLSLYTVKMDDTGDVYGDATRLKGDINVSGSHTTTACITRDGNTMYFTRSSGNKKKDTYNVLKIYRATKEHGKWVNVEELPINGDGFSTAHPALSPTEDRLYFASDRPESMGMTDIFYAPLYRGGRLGKVENAGEDVNTYGRESFPYVTENNELYFSSDGHFGLGGYDVFYSKISSGGNFGNVLNVGEPINTAQDDFSFLMNFKTKKGFVTHNLGPNNDNIYAIEEQRPIRDVFESVIYGTVMVNTMGASQEPLAGAVVYLYDGEMNIEDSIATDQQGKYMFNTSRFKDYYAESSKPSSIATDQYGTETKLVYSSVKEYVAKGKEENEVNFELDVVGTNLFDKLKLNPILFDYNKSNIRPDAAIELDKIIAYLKGHPGIKKIDIRSHTDSRGNDNYNMKLSERRAQSTYDYMVSQGISGLRMTYKGYGESQLLNNCSNGVECSESEHQENRRSEFIIVEVK